MMRNNLPTNVSESACLDDNLSYFIELCHFMTILYGYVFCPRKMFYGLSRAAKVRTKSQFLLHFPTNICERIEILKKVSQVGSDLIVCKGRPECLFLGEQKFIYEK